MKGSLSDKFLIASSIAGDEEAFGKIYDKYIDEIYRFILIRVSNQEDAQDLASDTFLKTWEYLSSGEKHIDNVRALLYRVGRNIVIDYYRKSGKQFQAISEDQFKNIVDASYDLEKKIEQKDDVRIIFSVLGSISEEAREIILMRYAHDLSISEIAKILGKSNGTVRVALHRAVKQLKSILKEM